MLAPCVSGYAELRADEGQLRAMLDAGAARAREVSGATLTEMKLRMGFDVPGSAEAVHLRL